MKRTSQLALHIEGKHVTKRIIDSALYSSVTLDEPKLVVYTSARAKWDESAHVVD